MPQYFAIVGKSDNPVYEAEFAGDGPNGAETFPRELRELNPFILHASLDIVEDLQWQPRNNGGGLGGGFLRSRNAQANDNLYLGKVDHFYGLIVTAYVSYSGMKFLMLHRDAPEDAAVRQFFLEVHELYVKTVMSPFYRFGTALQSSAFDSRVRMLAKKHLR